MKRVLFCAFLCILIIGNVSALNLTKTVVAATPQLVVKPGFQVTFSPSVTPAENQWATLQINSNPPGAEIWGSNNFSDYYTPMYLPQIYPCWTYRFFLKYPGYEPYPVVVNAQIGEAVIVSAILVPLPTTTQPVVTQTPLSQTDSLPTNIPATQQIQGQTTSSESTGSLSITTTPAGAEVSVDNEVKGISPAMISGLPPGTHALKISKAGYQDFSTTISIEAGKVREYSTGLTSASITSATTPANSIGFPVFAAIIALIGLVLVRKRSR